MPSNSMSRAGLVSILLLFFSVSLVTSAPLAERLSSLAARYNDYDTDFVARSLRSREFGIADTESFTRDYPSLFDDREFDMDLEYDEATKREYLSTLEDRNFEELDCEYAKRDVSESDLFVLYRRNIFSKMRNSFRRLGRKVSGGFKSFGKKVNGGFQSFGRKTQAEFQTMGRKVSSPFQKIGGKVKAGFQNFGGKVNGGFRQFGGKVNTGFRKVKAGIRQAGKVLNKGFKKASGVLNKGFNTAGQYLKANGAKMAKVGLKLYAAYTATAARIVKYIPGVGQPLSMALKGVSMGAKIGSSQIHANLDGKFGEVSNGIDYVLDPAGAIGKLAVKGLGKQGGAVGQAGNIVSSIMF